MIKVGKIILCGMVRLVPTLFSFLKYEIQGNTIGRKVGRKYFELDYGFKAACFLFWSKNDLAIKKINIIYQSSDFVISGNSQMDADVFSRKTRFNHNSAQ